MNDTVYDTDNNYSKTILSTSKILQIKNYQIH